MTDDRIEQFTAEIREMKVKAPAEHATNRDPVLTWVGAAAMAGGVVLAVVAYFLSHGTTNPLEQNDYQILAVIGLTLAVVGGAVYLKATLTQFLRFWLARFIHEQKGRDQVRDRDSTS